MGEIRVRPMARAKNRRAAAASRRGERNTSTTWPNWSMARKLPGSRGLGELRCEPLDPPVHRDVVDLDAALSQELFDVAVGEIEPQVPPDRQGDDLRGGIGIRRRPRAGLDRGERAGEISWREHPRWGASTANATVPSQVHLHLWRLGRLT